MSQKSCVIILDVPHPGLPTVLTNTANGLSHSLLPLGHFQYNIFKHLKSIVNYEKNKNPTQFRVGFSRLGVLGFLDQLGKGLGVVDGQLGQHFAVNINTGAFQAAHELGI